VQPEGEENSFFSFSPQLLLTVFVVSAPVNIGLIFGFKMFGLKLMDST